MYLSMKVMPISTFKYPHKLSVRIIEFLLMNTSAKMSSSDIHESEEPNLQTKLYF